MASVGPRAMHGTRFKSSSWKWWPGPESNHRHADFQYLGEVGSVRARRRLGTGFREANRTAPLDRAYSDPGSRNSARTRGGPIRFNDLRASRPNSFRTLRRIGRAAPHRVTTSRMRSCDSRLRPNVSTRGFNAIAPQRPYTCTVTSHARPMPFHRKPANTLRAQRGPSTISHEDIRETVCIMVNQVR